MSKLKRPKGLNTLMNGWIMNPLSGISHFLKQC